jgi:branched-chain amino acid transport system substrate-binding protein
VRSGRRRRGPVLVHWLLTLALLLAAAACAEEGDGGGEGGGSQEGPIRIGAILDVTGAGASLGAPERDTLQLLADQVNQAGGVDGRRIELILADNQSQEDQAARAMNRMVTTDQVDIVLGASRTGPSLAMKDIAEQSKMPMISLAANQAIVDGAQWVFKTAQNDVVVVEKLTAYMRLKGWKTIGLARDASAFGEGVADLFNQVGQEAGIRVVQEERFAPDATDFTAQMVNLRGARADVNVIWGIPPAAALATKAYRELGLQAPLLHSHGIGNDVFLETAGEAGNGVVFPIGRLLVASDLPDDDPQKEVIQKFVADYRARYGRAPSTFAGHAWDAFHLAVDAFREVGTDQQAVRDHLEQTRGFVGISGVFNMTPEDHSGLGTDALVMVEVRDGDWALAPDPVEG